MHAVLVQDGAGGGAVEGTAKGGVDEPAGDGGRDASGWSRRYRSWHCLLNSSRLRILYSIYIIIMCEIFTDIHRKIIEEHQIL